MRVYSTTPGTLTLSDAAGQTVTREVTTGSMRLVTTEWTRPSHDGDRELHWRVGSLGRRHHLTTPPIAWRPSAEGRDHDN